MMTRFFGIFVVIMATWLAGDAVAQTGSAPTQAEIDAAPACGKARDLEAGAQVLCLCEAGGRDRFIWGSGPYTGHSDICTAARHAGVVGTDGGAVIVLGRAGQKTFEAGDANGVTGRRWGYFKNGFDVVPATGRAVETAAACAAFVPENAPYECSCPAGAVAGSVWGDGPYTGDSDVCVAARHAGVLTDAGGTILVSLEAGQAAYQGSTANGVATRDWGSYDHSFAVAPKPVKVAATAGETCGTMPTGSDDHDCSCGAASGASGAVWGSGPYTADSDICTAARHAGAVTDAGGAVHVRRVLGLAGYRGSAANGVETSGWGAFETSIIFDRN